MADPTEPQKKGSEIEQIATELNRAIDESIRVVPEGLVYNNFLPLWCGEPVPVHITMALWASIAGSPFKPVNVIDSKGSFVYQVPPIFEMDGLKISDRKAFSIHGMLMNVNNLNNSFPARAKEYFESHMALLGLQNDPALFADKYAEQWNIIFSRYGKPLLTTVERLKKKIEQIEISRSHLSYEDDDFS